jgi:2-polyprenyl-3-methyl-5-hydroxy-6-metoxy-1,4-benzoquinol methylase
VLDVGFGGGQMLKAMPKCCRLTGAEISVSAVENANADPEFKAWKSASFELIAEDDAEALPRGPFDVILSSHTLEHVPDDRAALAVIRDRLAPEGLLFLFVPIEEPNYNPDHIRNYSVDSIAALVGEHLEVIHVEPSMHINGHIWKIITIPSRRKWWGLQWVVDRFRRVTLASIPYEGQRKLDAALDWIGVGPRQALVVARRSA